MSVSFLSLHSKQSLDLSNGTASRLLKAIGYPVSEETSGSMPLEEALAGIQKAKGTLGSPEDEERLLDLESFAQGIQSAGAKLLAWT